MEKNAYLTRSENPAAVVVAGGPRPPLEWARPRLQGAPLLFCADAGLRLCLDCGVMPHMLIGDFDSITPAELAGLPPLRFGIERHPVDKDFSDLQLALQALARHWQGPVELLGARGGRIDHELFNLCAVLFLAKDLGLEARAVDPDTVVFPLLGQLTLTGYVGCTCSILPLSDSLHDVTLRGFRYALKGESLARRETRGLSNVIEEDSAHIVAQGEGLVIVTPRPG